MGKESIFCMLLCYLKFSDASERMTAAETHWIMKTAKLNQPIYF